jgi:hypothetical protein
MRKDLLLTSYSDKADTATSIVRPGSIISIPTVHARRGDFPYKLRVGKLEICAKTRWDNEFRVFKATSCAPNLPREVTAIVDDLEAVIELGHLLLAWLDPRLELPNTENLNDLYYQLCSLWHLCITVGTAICETDGQFGSYMNYLPGMASSAREIFEKVEEGAEEHGFDRNADDTALRKLPKYPKRRRIPEDEFAEKIMRDDEMSVMIADLANFSVRCQMKRSEE